ncbi:hypothetical protein H5T56_02795 [Candidatus Bipolaricaulota bacterium]|nr:hypothetical protein [Candidatus Bipolaricaulota bacterium]
MLEVFQPERFTRADWEELFRQATRGLDPWALDITVLIGRFREFLTKTPVEMRVPGRMVLASSVLLRMKSERMEGKATLKEAVEAVVAEETAEEEDPFVYVAPELRLPLRRRPKARVTIADLRRALLATLAKPARPKPPAQEAKFLPQEEPFKVRALRLLRRLLSMVNGQRVVPFSQLLENDDPKERVARFLELLHLDGQGKVRLYQPEFLGEILIEVPHDS